MRNLLLSTVTISLVPAVSVASPEFNLSTHTTPIELKPISQLDLAYKTAGVCFLGVGDCDPNVGFGKGDEDYTVDTAAQCKNEGFIANNCNSVQTPTAYCPMLLANATQILFLVLLRKLVKVPVAAENINPVSANPNICTLHQIVHLLVLFLVLLVAENTPDVLARPALVPVLLVVRNIILPLALMFVKEPKQIIATTVPLFQHLTDVPSIGQIVPLNVKRLIMIIAVTERPLLVNMAVLLTLVIVNLSVKLAEPTLIVMLLPRPVNMVVLPQTLVANVPLVRVTRIVMLRL